VLPRKAVAFTVWIRHLWLPGSNIEQAFKAIKEAEKLHKQATAQLTKTKKDLAKTMLN